MMVKLEISAELLYITILIFSFDKEHDINPIFTIDILQVRNCQGVP